MIGPMWAAKLAAAQDDVKADLCAYFFLNFLLAYPFRIPPHVCSSPAGGCKYAS